MTHEKKTLHIMFTLVHFLKKGFKKFLMTYDITEMEAKILLLAENNQIKTSNIINHFKKHKSTITQKTRALEHKGYIFIKNSPDDKRERIIHLTEKGIAFNADIKDAEREFHNNAFADFSGVEKKQLLNLLEKIDIKNYENIC